MPRPVQMQPEGQESTGAGYRPELPPSGTKPGTWDAAHLRATLQHCCGDICRQNSHLHLPQSYHSVSGPSGRRRPRADHPGSACRLWRWTQPTRHRPLGDRQAFFPALCRQLYPQISGKLPFGRARDGLSSSSHGSAQIHRAAVPFRLDLPTAFPGSHWTDAHVKMSQDLPQTLRCLDAGFSSRRNPRQIDGSIPARRHGWITVHWFRAVCTIGAFHSTALALSPGRNRVNALPRPPGIFKQEIRAAFS